MNRLLLSIPILALVAATAMPQPNDGDLILTYGVASGGAVVVDPQTKAWSTLATAPTALFYNWVAMDRNNMDLVVGSVDRQTKGVLVRVDPRGKQQTISPPFGSAHGFELDHDGSWLIASVLPPAIRPPNQATEFCKFDGTNLTTLFSRPLTTGGGVFTEMAIDRDPGAVAPYLLAVYEPPSISPTKWHLGAPTARLLGATRKGIVTTVVSSSGNALAQLTGVELDCATGDYLTCGQVAPQICRVTKRGQVSSLKCVIQAPNAMKINPDGTAWVVSEPNLDCVLYRIALDGTVLTFFRVDGFNPPVVTGLEVYGSRRLVCTHPSPTTHCAHPNPAAHVAVDVQCRSPLAAGKQYALAASLARRPGFRMSCGEWLHLDTVNDPLFFITARNLVPDVFVKFRGALDASGNARACVAIPPPLQGLGIPVFVAGVIFDQTGVQQVTNTHWFVL